MDTRLGVLVAILDKIRTFLAYRHPRWAKTWKTLAAVLFIINSILIPVFIAASWEASQTLDNIRVDCGPYLFSNPAKEIQQSLTFNRFNASILLDNPTLLSLHLTWSVQLNLNDSLPDNIWLFDDVGPGQHWATLQVSYQEPYAKNLNISLSSISFLEIDSVSSILAQDRYSLVTLPYTENIPHGMSMGNYTANRLDGIVYYAFVQHHNLNNWKGFPICSS
jgi:hypothetical protein